MPTTRDIPVIDLKALYGRSGKRVREDDELRDSIRLDGIKQPLLVSANLTVLNGHRRLAQAKHLNMDRVPCLVDESVVSDDDILRAVMACDVQAKRSAIEQAEVLFAYLRITGCRQKDLADKFGKSAGTVSRHLEVFNYCDEVIQYARDDRLQIKHFLAVKKLPPDARESALRDAAANGLDVTAMMAHAGVTKGKPPRVKEFACGRLALHFPEDLPFGELMGELQKLMQEARRKLREVDKADLPATVIAEK